jgi:hypothetical protein
MIGLLDTLRSKVLKFSLQAQVLKQLFLNRSNRVFLLFSLAFIFYLSASLFFPLWVLFLGPIIWGVPHLISSLRYTNLNFDKKKKYRLHAFQFSAWALVFVYRFCIDILKIDLFWAEYTLLFESFVLMSSFIFQTYVVKRWSMNSFIYFLFFSGLILSTYYFTIETALLALIGHNYVPLIAWYKSCQNKNDTKIFAYASLLFITTSVLILKGAFDGLYTLLAPSGHINFLNWDYSEVIAPFVRENYDYQFWFRVVVLYAFSQALHYFIWLKAIPENFQQSEHSPSFRWSYLKLSNDFGSSSVLLLGLLILFSSGIWLVYEFQVARLVYFGLASYHGFMEISAIPFLKSNLSKTRAH